MFLKDTMHTGFNSEESILKPPLELIWIHEKSGGSPIITGKTVFVRGDQYLWSLDADTGEEKWSYYIGSGSHTSPASAYNTVFVGRPCNNCSLDAIDVNTGLRKWSIPLPRGARDASVFNDVVFFGSDDWHVRAADAYTGKPLLKSSKKDLILDCLFQT